MKYIPRKEEYYRSQWRNWSLLRLNNFEYNKLDVRVTPGGVGQAGEDALGDGGLDGHEGAKAGSVSWAGNDTRQG